MIYSYYLDNYYFEKMVADKIERKGVKIMLSDVLYQAKIINAVTFTKTNELLTFKATIHLMKQIN